MRTKSIGESSSSTAKRVAQILLKLSGFILATFIMLVSVARVSDSFRDSMRAQVYKAAISHVQMSSDSIHTIEEEDRPLAGLKAPNTSEVIIAAPTLEHPVLRWVILLAIMLVGVVCGHLHNFLSERSRSGESVTFLLIKQSFTKASLWRSLLASPILFSVVYSACQSQPDLVLAGFFAFQNGFLCNVVLDRQVAAASTPASVVGASAI